MRGNILKTIVMASCLSALTLVAAAAEDQTFSREIHPVLSSKCFDCHGPSEEGRKGDLRLDIPDGELGALTERGDYHIVLPGKPEDSELWKRITSDDADEVMPPPDSHKEPLTKKELALVKQWILDGGEYQQFWSFVPPKKSLPPEITNTAWSSGAIDGHVMARLESEGLSPNKEADKRSLIRRVTFDLTGLPPTLAEIEAFIKDESPDAYSTLVDDLIARPAYGEHMTRYWADLVRLSDTNGMHKDFPRNFTAYRDWIIRSFNENLPYDTFITYQLAGDLYDAPSRDQLVASGFNRLHLIIDRGTALPEESLHKNILDRVAAFGTTFLGMTVHCAQCHDHKSDPITQQDFYQIYAFFNNFGGAPETEYMPKRGLQPPFINLTTPEQEAKLAEYTAELQSLNQKLAVIKDKADQADRAEKLKKEIDKTQRRSDAFVSKVPGAMIMQERTPVRPATILVRGAYDAPGDPVERNTPAFLPPMNDKEGMYTRMDLAEWLVDPEHPLTARVAVNRIWQQFFGVGLVKTPEDFGAQGERPSHPELLDDLAVDFIASGWDIKKLVRQIVLSNTYKQDSDAPQAEFINDPENRMLARGSRFRMDAEMIRDQMLSVSGLLNDTMYGRSVKPPQPPGLWEMVSMAEPKTYVADTDDSIYRRSLYTYWRRGMPPPQMTIMNAPSREFCVAKRERTNTPLQALLLMNEQEYLKAARACAQLTLEKTDDVRAGLSLTYEKITSHLPDAERLDFMESTLNEFRAIYSADQALAESLTADINEVTMDDRVELAAWTMMAHSLLNLELAKVKR